MTKIITIYLDGRCTVHDFNRRSKKKDGNYKTAEEIVAENVAFKAVLEQLINLKGLTLEINGNWLWISGNTYDHRSKIKGAGCKFVGDLKKWYWYAGDKRRKTK